MRCTHEPADVLKSRSEASKWARGKQRRWASAPGPAGGGATVSPTVRPAARTSTRSCSRSARPTAPGPTRPTAIGTDSAIIAFTAAIHSGALLGTQRWRLDAPMDPCKAARHCQCSSRCTCRQASCFRQEAMWTVIQIVAGLLIQRKGSIDRTQPLVWACRLQRPRVLHSTTVDAEARLHFKP